MTARSRSRAGGCSASSARTARGRRRRCARSSGSSSSTRARCSGTGGRSGWRSGCGSATCRRSAASTRGCRSASSSSTSAACTGWTRDAARAAAARWLERLGLADRAEAKVEELSHGNQQRAQLAAALLHEPELLVLDEPFAGLDPVAVHTLAEVLRGEAARGAAVLFSSHQLELVEDICEEVAIIDHGRIVATGDVDALRRGSQRRRIELQLDGAPPQWLPDVAGVELVERRNGDLRLLAGRDVDPEQVLAAAERTARVVEFSYGPAVACGALPGAGGAMSGRRAITLVARREIRERLRSKRLPRLDAGHARARRRVDRAPRARSRRTDVPRRGDRAGAARPRRRTPTRGEAVRRREGAAARASPRRQPDGRRSKPSRSTRSCSCPTTGSSSGRTSTRRPPRSQTRPCARSAATCRRRRS